MESRLEKHMAAVHGPADLRINDQIYPSLDPGHLSRPYCMINGSRKNPLFLDRWAPCRRLVRYAG